MKTIVCSGEDMAFVQANLLTNTNSDITAAYRGLPIRTDRFLPTWKTYPRPKRWRRWFLREKQRAPERVFFVIDMPTRQELEFKWGLPIL